MPDPSPSRPPRTVPALFGVVLALPFLGLFLYHPDGAVDLLALLLALTGGVYVGAALRHGVGRLVLALEVVMAAWMMVCAALGLWWAPWWLAVGFTTHGVWDMVHHPRALDVGVRRWFPPFCAAFDAVVAALILYFG